MSDVIGRRGGMQRLRGGARRLQTPSLPATAKALRSFHWRHILPRHCNVIASSRKSASSLPHEDRRPLSSQPAKAGTGPRPRPPCRSPTQRYPYAMHCSPKPARTAGHLPDHRREAHKRAPELAPPEQDEGTDPAPNPSHHRRSPRNTRVDGTPKTPTGAPQGKGRHHRAAGAPAHERTVATTGIHPDPRPPPCLDPGRREPRAASPRPTVGRGGHQPPWPHHPTRSTAAAAPLAEAPRQVSDPVAPQIWARWAPGQEAPGQGRGRCRPSWHDHHPQLGTTSTVQQTRPTGGDAG